MKLKNHIEEHERLEKDCELGGKQFKDETKLKFHMKCEHERKKIDCEKCGKKADDREKGCKCENLIIC